jgi:nicotinamide-nucleotide amidase
MNSADAGNNAPHAPTAGDLMAQQLGPIQERLASVFDGSETALAVAESLTGGELSAAIARSPGAADWFRGGLVAYSSAVKYDVLDVPPGPVVSEVAVAAMAEGACRLLGADLAIAVTGVAGPDEQDGQAPGTVWFGLHDGRTTTTRVEHFPGEPESVVDATIEWAVQLLVQHLAGLADAG